MSSCLLLMHMVCWTFYHSTTMRFRVLKTGNDFLESMYSLSDAVTRVTCPVRVKRGSQLTHRPTRSPYPFLTQSEYSLNTFSADSIPTTYTQVHEANRSQ